ncbi:hypothetical protein [Escherichia coli]|uniref:hypothetical protein n=1 Tax=Escherichia coli TaxID=562 RepID=UPI003D1C2433
MGEISVKTGNNARNGGKNSLNRLIRCVCGKKIGPDPRNFNQRVSLGRNDLLIRTFPKGTIFSAFPVLNNKAMWRWYQNEDIGEYYWQTELGTCKNNKFTPSGARLLIRVGSLRLNENHAIKGTLQELINTAEKTAFLGDRFRSYIRAGIYQKKSSDPVQLLAVLDNSIMVKYFKDEKPTYARMTAHLPNKNESYECLIKIQHELIRSEEK